MFSDQKFSTQVPNDFKIIQNQEELGHFPLLAFPINDVFPINE